MSTAPTEPALSGDTDPGLSEAAPAPPLGNRYEILALLGSGGMGHVYKVRDRVLDEIVALKTLRRELLINATAIDRFRSEVRLARRVTHRNVARTFDTGVEGGIPYLTMELIEGESLEARLVRERRLAADESARIAAEICEALDAAHTAGVVHRDLKPQNVILSRDGRVVLTDFGIARMHDGGPARATALTVAGTPAYMAPEQALGEAIGPRADLFALGVMLFELVTGELPWRGPTPLAMLAARLTEPAPDPGARVPGLPEPLASLVRRLLQRAADDRPSSARAVAAELAGMRLDHSTLPPMRSISITPIAPVRGADRTLAILPLRLRGGDEVHLSEGFS